MGLVRNVTKNALAMASVQFISLVSTLVLSIVLAKYLGKELYGTYTLAFSLATLIFFIADFNLGFQLVVEVAPNKEIASKRLTSTLLLRAILGTVALVVTFAVALLENMPANVIYAIMIIAIATAFNWLYQTFTSMYTAFEKMHFVLLTSVVERMFTVTTAVVLVILGFGLETVVLVVLAGSMLQFLLAYLVCSRFIVKPVRTLSVAESALQLKRAVPYALADLAINSLYSVNAVLVFTLIAWSGSGTAAAQAATGMYNISFSMVTAMVALPTILIVALIPVISRMYKSSKEMTQMTQQKVMKYMFSLGLPIAVGGVILADRIITLFYGTQYSPAITVFQILIPAVAISFFDSGMASVLASAKKVRLITIANVMGALANIVLCFALIPYFHEVGAALAFTLAYLLLVVMTFFFLTRNVFKVNLVDIMFRPSMAAFGMAVVLLLMPWHDLFISLGVGIAIYFGLLFLIKGINQEDRDILVKIWKKGA